MVRRKGVIAAGIGFLVALMVFIFSASSWAVTTDPTTYVFTLKANSDNTTCTADAVYISKQLLDPNGQTFQSGGVEIDNVSNVPLYTDINNCVDTDNQTILSFEIPAAEGSLANNVALYLYIDNGTAQGWGKVAPSTGATFYLDNASIYAAAADAGITGTPKVLDIKFADDVAKPYPAVLPFHVTVNGSLNSGDMVHLILTSTYNGAHIVNGCYKRVIYVVEDQWIAKLCMCNGGVDTDYIIPTDNGTTVEDSEGGFKGISLYNACSSYSGSGTTPTTECCPTLSGTCSLFCNQVTSSTSGTTGVTTATCSIPGYCNNPPASYMGLQIFENRDFTLHPSYKIISLANTDVTFTLNADSLKNIDKIELLGYGLSSGGLDPNATVLGTFNIDTTTNTATVTIPGSALFVKANGGVQVADYMPTHFTIKITPKANTVLMPNEFKLSAVMQAGGDLKNPQNLNWGTFLKWTYNLEASMVFKVPYIRCDSYVSSVIRFENASAQKALVALFVNDPVTGGWMYVKSLEVPAGGSVAVSGSDIIGYAHDMGITLNGTKGFAVYGLVSSTESKFTLYASQQVKGSNSFRPLPVKVLHNGNFFSE